MRPDYEAWLRTQQYSANTVAAQLHRVRRVEEVYGSLDDKIGTASMNDLIQELNYGVEDERRSRPNPSRMKFEGNIRNNLQSYKNAVVRYQRFATSWSRAGDTDAFAIDESASSPTLDGEAVSLRTFSLERDMQRALRDNIASLGRRLRIVDDGMERAVDSGLIDITCESLDDSALVVVELKAGRADGRAVAQILGYMGDLKREEDPRVVRGLLIAQDFDQRARSAASMVPTLELLSYSITFEFKPAATV